MKIGFQKLALPKKGAVVAGVMEGGKLLPLGAELDEQLGGLLSRAMKANKFTGKAKQTLSVFGENGTVLLYGLGDGSGIDELWCENAGGAIVAAILAAGDKEVSVLFEPHTADGNADEKAADRAARLAFGGLLRTYRFDKYKTKLKKEDKPVLQKLTVLTNQAAEAKKAAEALEAIAEGVFLARDLVSEPPNVLYPVSYAKRCEELKELGVKVEVLDEKQMAKLGMGALLGVGQGSERESRLVVMRWEGGPKKQQPIAFVGKGVCFDTGGISLKPAGGMEDMKWDMGGSATVVGLMKALAGRKAKANVIGVVGLVENMPDGNAQRPGDVVTSMSGQTIEIINTDAEGRLVLADALWYTQDRFKPQFMLDLATLTGAMMVALGQVNCGYFSNSDELVAKLEAASKASGEKIWRMPLGEEYNKMMDSDIADVKNAGARWGGSITAACFLERFVNDLPWVHMDIAGMAWSQKDSPTVPKGGTGWGVRLLDEMVRANYEA
jgi:leucyl aminopeptidase